ncbi:MAG: Spy/CpxP family protein refolding chaperone [Gemmatimonadaceae bacterium]|nr:Spy/CpxP family protein refolding chaperone [Gemmatimonadaceae bacterium]
MSALRNFALAAVAAAAFSGTAHAQHMDRGHDHGRAGPMSAFHGLNLSEAQKTQIKAIHTRYEPQLRASRDQAKPFLEAARAARQKGDTAAVRANLEKARQLSSGIRQQEMSEVRAVFTPAQRAQADSLMAQHSRNGAGPGFGPGAMRGRRDERARPFASLNLTEAQETQVKAIRAKYQGQAKSAREQERNEIRAVLTADQRAKFDSVAAGRKQHAGEREGRRGNRGGRGGQHEMGGKPNRGV